MISLGKAEPSLSINVFLVHHEGINAAGGLGDAPVRKCNELESAAGAVVSAEQDARNEKIVLEYLDQWASQSRAGWKEAPVEREYKSGKHKKNQHYLTGKVILRILKSAFS